MELEITVTEFIAQFRNEGTKKVFTEGCCYWFAQILCTRFLLSEIAYNPLRNHFAARIGGRLYDITGEITDHDGWMDWNDYLVADPVHAEVVTRDCINKET